MAKPFLTSIDLNLNEVLNFLVQKLGVAPNATEARLYYNSTEHNLYYHNGTKWVGLGSDVDITGKADKVTSATSGHLASLDASGNLADSGKSETDFLLAALKGAVNGVASLGDDGKVPVAQLPSYVDDVVDVLTFSDTAPVTELSAGVKYYEPTAKKLYTYSGSAWDGGATPESDKIYIRLDTSTSHRWSGTAMAPLDSGLVIGTTPTTAAAGNRGLPPGGVGGQALIKNSGDDYDGTWATPVKRYAATCPALAPSSGAATWTITHGLGVIPVVEVYRVSDGVVVIADVIVTVTTAVVTLSPVADTIAAGAYGVVCVG